MKTSANYYAVLVILFITLVFSTLSCKKSNPAGPDEIKPGRRDYVWTADTIKLKDDMLYLDIIWGSSPTDVWIVCRGSSNSKLLWHYDGNKWKTDSNNVIIAPKAVYGFAQNNVWIGNNVNSFWKYEGSSWRKTQDIKSPEGYAYNVIEGLWGTNPNDIYAVGWAQKHPDKGYKAIILHFNGKLWDYLNVPDTEVGLADVVKQVRTGLVFLHGITHEAVEKLLVYDGSLLKVIYPGPRQPSVGAINGEAYLVIDKTIYKYINGGLVVWKDFSNTNYSGRIWGRSEMDFFCGTWEGIGHYNGTDLRTIYQTQLHVYGAMIFEKDVFFITHDYDKDLNIVFHGKLKEN